MKRKTTEDFINDAKKVHGDQYDYSLVQYVNTKTPVKILCFKHGEFYQTPFCHLRKQGCPKCAVLVRSRKNSKDTKQFIERANKKHNSKYDYSLTQYTKTHKKVTIICPTHGKFKQKANDHLNGHGCPKCIPNSKLSTESFIEKAITKHGLKYDYSLVEYVNARKTIKIICKTHGIFKQQPYSHLLGRGCPKCHGTQRKTTKEFIRDARNIHGYKYDYSQTHYQTAHTKVVILCGEHGEFIQTPIQHLQGTGCPKCKETKGERTIRVWLEQHDISYEYQKAFNNCYFKRPLKFDFFVPSYNTLIEFNGEQHYSPNHYFHESQEQFEKQIERDRIKQQYAKQNNYTLIILTENDDIPSTLKNSLH